LELTNVTNTYDQHFLRAKKFIEKNANTKPTKCRELLTLLDEDHRTELQQLLDSLTKNKE
jgi:chemotaxis methyl-accepting protein methylase